MQKDAIDNYNNLIELLLNHLSVTQGNNIEDEDVESIDSILNFRKERDRDFNLSGKELLNRNGIHRLDNGLFLVIHKGNYIEANHNLLSKILVSQKLYRH